MSKLNLDYLFQPQSIAIIGISSDLTRVVNPGREFTRSLVYSGFQGKIYPVGPAGGEVFGLRVHQNIRDIPGPIDYVISAIPAQYTPQLMVDCAAKEVKAIHFFTSGFSEIEGKKGARLEAEILKTARQHHIRIIGPNCMGLYCPKTGLTFAIDLPEQKGFPKQSGPLGLISQSGGNSNYCVNEGAERGMYFSKVVSYGNASDLSETDFLEYFTYDPDTKVIAAYIEGIKDGQRFSKALKRAARAKPVIIYKAGMTEAGTRASASHTGSIAGSDKTWEALLKQAGAIQVHSIEAIIDVALLFMRISRPKGRNTAVVGAGGGASVRAADECSKAGLTLPLLPAQIRKKLIEINGTEAGQFYKNPVDAWDTERLPETIKEVANCGQVDLLMAHVAFDMWPLANKRYIVEPAVTAIINASTTMSKPMVAVLHTQSTKDARQLASAEQERLCEAGLAVYPSFSRAASAVDKFIKYHERHRNGHKVRG